MPEKPFPDSLTTLKAQQKESLSLDSTADDSDRKFSVGDDSQTSLSIPNSSIDDTVEGEISMADNSSMAIETDMDDT